MNLCRCSWLPAVGLFHGFLHTLVTTPRAWEGCLVLGFALVREADLTVLCHLVPWPSPSHTILCASPELVCHGRGYLGHLWDCFLNVGAFLSGEYLFSKDFFYSVTSCSLSE